MEILPHTPFNFRQIYDHQPKSGDSCLKSPFNLWPYCAIPYLRDQGVKRDNRGLSVVQNFRLSNLLPCVQPLSDRRAFLLAEY